MRDYKLKLINSFFIYILLTVIFGLYFYFYFPAHAFVYTFVSFLAFSVIFVFYMKNTLQKLSFFVKEQLDSLGNFVEKGTPFHIKDPIFEELFQEISLKSQEIKRVISDFAKTNGIIKSRINDILYSFEELIDDYRKFNEKFLELMENVSSISKENLNIKVEDKLQSFVTLTVEISKFKEQLLFLVEKVKEIVNDYIIRTSEDVKNANFVIKGFLSFSENLVLSIDKISLFLNNISAYSERLHEEVKKIEKHRDGFRERVGRIRDNFDGEKELLDEIIGLNRTSNDVFYDLKTALIEISNLNKKASLMSLNALIYASETSQENDKFSSVARELKKLVEDMEGKYSEIKSYFEKLFEANGKGAKLLTDFETVTMNSRIELSKIGTDIEHLTHHIKMIEQSHEKIVSPIEENLTILGDLKEGITNHSTAIKQVLIVFKDYIARLEKAEKDKEAFDSLVVATSSLLDYINNNLPSLTSYITELFKSLKDFAAQLENANEAVLDFTEDKSVKEFGKMLEELQFKRLESLKNSIVLLEKAKNIKKIL